MELTEGTILICKKSYNITDHFENKFFNWTGEEHITYEIVTK
jgi:hypothetical protein